MERPAWGDARAKTELGIVSPEFARNSLPEFAEFDPEFDMQVLPYNPGPLPTKPSPSAGDSFTIELPGLPPYKDTSRSIRNLSHPRYESFVTLRRAAIATMDGRAWYQGPVQLDLTIHAPTLHKNRTINDYLGGVMDTLDGSHGPTFTYLPIVYEDDCQVAMGCTEYVESTEERYTVHIEFLPR